MKPSDDSFEPLASRLWLKAFFWVAVASAWGLVLSVIAFISLAVFFGGRPSAVEREVSVGLTSNEVRARAGRPDHEFEDATSWLFIIKASDGCDTSSISSAWLYSHVFQDDAMVYFDERDRVVCVHSGGKIIYNVSY